MELPDDFGFATLHVIPGAGSTISSCIEKALFVAVTEEINVQFNHNGTTYLIDLPKIYHEIHKAGKKEK